MIKQRIKAILDAIGEGLLERDEVLALALLSALADESIFLLGLPGVGKSLVARRLKQAFSGAGSFEYLMSRFSTPDEIFGPVSIAMLKEADTYQRVTRGYLPEAEIVFLDEIWKAGPAIQNSLLTVLNEKTYLNGNQQMHLPLKAIIAASNELPAKDEGLEALWDRFVIRYIVEPIKDRRNFQLLIDSPGHADQPPIPGLAAEPLSADECRSISLGKARTLLPPDIVDVICRLRERLQAMADTNPAADFQRDRLSETDYYISDRRWLKAVGILKTSAHINDRPAVDYSDLLLLSHMLWNEDSQVMEVRRMVCEEIVARLFKKMLDAQKSSKRHAVGHRGRKPHSPDGVHYVAMCDGFSLKIRIDDYERLLGSGEYVFASETPDERLVFHQEGSYAVQVLQPGRVTINGYSYPLATSVDPQVDSDSLAGMLDSVEDISENLSRQISANIMVDESRFIPLIRSVIAEYTRQRRC